MQALLMTKIRELQLVEVPEPEIEHPGDVLVEIRAAGVCGSDLHGYTGQSGRRIPPLIMGHEAAGVVLATGAEVEDLPPGTRVAIQPVDGLGSERRLMGMDAPGAFAPRVVWPARHLYRLPDAVSFEAGSLVEPLGITIRAVGKIPPESVTSAVVVGAGTIGLLTASVLRQRGVERIAITDLSPQRLDVARRLGLDLAVNPAEDDPREAVLAMTDGAGADVAFEAVGTSATVAQAHAVVRYGGAVVWIGNNHKTIEVDMQRVVTRELSVHGTYGMTEADFREAIELLAGGAIAADELITRRAELREGPELFEELLTSPEVVKCVFSFPGGDRSGGR